MRVLNIKFHGNPFSGSCADTCEQTDKRTCMTKVIGVFRGYMNAPNLFHYCSIVVNTYVNLRRQKLPKASAKLINIDSHS